MAKFTKFLAILSLSLCFISLLAQQPRGNVEEIIEYESSRYNYRVYTIDGQKVGSIEFQEVEINEDMPNARRRRRGQRRLREYERLRYHVHKVHPYAVKVSQLLEEVDRELSTLPEGAERRAYIRQKEQNLFGQYEDDIRRMSRSQGRILVKLVHRETGDSMYQLIREMKSGATAVFWQSIGKLFGINLRDEYDASQDENRYIEHFVKELEAGGYNIVYKQRNYVLR